MELFTTNLVLLFSLTLLSQITTTVPKVVARLKIQTPHKKNKTMILEGEVKKHKRIQNIYRLIKSVDHNSWTWFRHA